MPLASGADMLTWKGDVAGGRVRKVYVLAERVVVRVRRRVWRDVSPAEGMVEMEAFDGRSG